MTIRRLIIGVGNMFRGDDAAGLIVARRLRDRISQDISIVEVGGDPLSIMEAWKTAGNVVLVDAVQSGRPPGTIHRFDARAAPIPQRLFRVSTHAISLPSVIELARTLGGLPPRLLLYGIEGKTFEAGNCLTPDVECAVDIVVDELATG
jgi:hydrogenase maturation protease